nr:MAG TPA: hypothetical protein [Caudoviricetes sp.]
MKLNVFGPSSTKDSSPSHIIAPPPPNSVH